METYEKVKHWEEIDGVEILKTVEINKGNHVIDFGCGFGHYSFAASFAVGDTGNVYAIDNNKKIINLVETSINDRKFTNITTINKDEKSFKDFDDSSIDCVLLYDILHGANINRFDMLNEVHRVLKNNGKLSILPFHLSNFRDGNGKKKKYKIESLISEICEFGFKLSSKLDNKGIHFEKYHSPHYIKQGGIEFEDLERGTIYNFIKS